ncbi:stAR-related lipid transfer protein 7, mitochondrial isoform X2 [Daktulosphaira vitifoliae]|uniref:stAR-related lipid transfer protein 7, mitochondrial isoform X2 n=1 Tax=Daktulosphaira vitifoliae TaxID=58002 RepID=UPI0021AAC1CA|nr:stAR-related lipid transfer protein 7, mitochondrial isoform X2 [Daktulosphaira vitifoliae]
MTLTSSICKSYLLLPPSRCSKINIYQSFAKYWENSLNNNYFVALLNECALHLSKKQKFNLCKKLFPSIQNYQKLITRHKERLVLCISLPLTFDWYNERICFDELLRLGQEFKIIDKLEQNNAFGSANVHNTNKTNENFKHDSSSLKQNNEIKINTTDKIQNSRECLIDICDCSRCKNMCVHGWFDDVSALDFMQVQLDLEYRKEWDKMSVDLNILDSEPLTCSDLIYWELRWPKWFQNRDYVFKRRYRIDEEEKIMSIVCESTEHPDYPEYSGKWRVKNYWSYIVIKPRTDFDKAGVEFSITYFDDPGVTVSNYLTSWYQSKGMPSFFNDQRKAALELARRRRDSNNSLSPDQLNIETNYKNSEKQTQGWMSWLFSYCLF